MATKQEVELVGLVCELIDKLRESGEDVNSYEKQLETKEGQNGKK